MNRQMSIITYDAAQYAFSDMCFSRWWCIARYAYMSWTLRHTHVYANSTDELLFCVFGMLTLITHSLNFHIYVIVGKQVRRENLKKALCVW